MSDFLPVGGDRDGISARTTRPLLLDLFCCQGGAAKGYHDAGFDVVGVDINEQPNYPYRFVCADALDFVRAWVREEWPVYSAIHASPPCQAYSVATRASGDPSSHPDLVAETRELLEATGLPYVIENVPGAPLHNPIQLCGSSFGLDVRRHRLFETNWPLMAAPCAHHLQVEPKYDVYEHGRWYKSPVVKAYGSGGGKAMEHWPAAMQIDWMDSKGLAQAIPPAYTEYIGQHLLRHLGYGLGGLVKDAA